jgi:hypothetical protein
MFMCVVNLKAVNKLDLTRKQSFLIYFQTLASRAFQDKNKVIWA